MKNYLDAFFLIVGMSFIDLGSFLIYIPAGFIVTGIGLVATAFLIAKIHAQRG